MSENSWKAETLNYAAVAIPAFFLFVALEYVIAVRKKKKDLFKFDSSIANITIGIAERLLNLFLTASFYGLFQFVYQHYSLFNIPHHWLVWVLLILSTDLVWYWYHRLGHEVNLFWAAHVVHHQSEEFNYTVSARITTLQAIVRNGFWCILPFIGFHPDMVIVTLIIHGTYSFFTHTEMIPRLGWLEYIFITPSHHRVHHASNEKYLNKNYGDLFVFWDKMFGTFQQEDEKPVYGLTHNLHSYSFIWQHFHYFVEMIHAMRITPGVWSKLKIIFGKPEELPDVRQQLEEVYLPFRSNVSSSRYKIYLVIQITLVTLLLFFTSLFYHYLTQSALVIITSLTIITLINCGALLDQRRWIYYLETIRLLIVLGYFSYVLESPLFFGAALSFVVLLFLPLEKYYYKLIYDS